MVSLNQVALFLLQIPSVPGVSALPWYQVAGGIVALIAAIIAIPYTLALVKKVRLEAQKTQLEIIEKARALNLDIATFTPISTELPGAQSANIYFVGSLILRFILFRLILDLWNIIHTPFGWLLMALQGGLMYLATKNVPMKVISIGWGLFFVLDLIINTIVYWLIFFTVAWPIFVDIMGYFGIKILRFRELYAHARNWRFFAHKIRDIPTEEH